MNRGNGHGSGNGFFTPNLSQSYKDKLDTINQSSGKPDSFAHLTSFPRLRSKNDLSNLIKHKG